MNINFKAPTNLIFGDNVILNNKELFNDFGSKCIIVTSSSAGKKSGALEDITNALDSQKITYIIHDSVKQNPLLEDAFSAGQKANKFGASFVIGVGGGSPLDAAKAVAIYAVNPNLSAMDIYKLDYKNKALPIIAVGLTAGTGSEVGKFSVLTTPDGLKQSIASNDCYPNIAFADPKYTQSLPFNFSVSTALDAMAHAIEAYFSLSGNSISDLFAFEAITILIKEVNLLKNSQTICYQSREKLLYASILAGYALDTCGTLYCHSLGYFLSEEHNVPHGLACAAYLPSLLKRAQKLLPDRALLLEEKIGISTSALIELVSGFIPKFDFAITAADINIIVSSKSGNKNFKNTAPAGLSDHEAIEIMQSIFL